LNQIIITGAAGFIGFHQSLRYLKAGHEVVGIDNLNDYYDVSLKQARLAILNGYANFKFHKLNLHHDSDIKNLFAQLKPKIIVHLAAQAGVAYSKTNPMAYLESNFHGFLNILEVARHSQCSHLLYASSSSVYGENEILPYHESQGVNHPLSLYAATKRANELMAHAYSSEFDLPTTGLRFFNVYGTYGRPDSVFYKFSDKILKDEPIELHNHGDMYRDFTHVDDVVKSIELLAQKPPAKSDERGRSPALSNTPFRILNIGNSKPEFLKDALKMLESALGQAAIVKNVDLPKGNIPKSQAETKELKAVIGFAPNTPLSEGIVEFVSWYKSYHGKKL
jgi:UDP-glucuronate 4-epimerase